MREIKFRAWDGFQKKMFDIKSLKLPHREDLSPEVYLMQFTGLLDKNGKEIYEGDILSIDNSNTEVCFYNGSFVVKDYFEGRPYDYLSHFDELDIKIIGNIYENPELLTN